MTLIAFIRVVFLQQISDQTFVLEKLFKFFPIVFFFINHILKLIYQILLIYQNIVEGPKGTSKRSRNTRVPITLSIGSQFSLYI